jgi:Family of unknown function (DUF6348)
MEAPFSPRVVSLVLAQQLSELGGKWKGKGDGVRGPRNLGVVVAESACGPACLELGFQWDRKDPGAPVTWDHVTCFGESDADLIGNGVWIWGNTTAPALLEVLARDGRFADHYHSGDAGGVPGWHVVHGPWLGWGAGDEGVDAAEELQAWAVAQPPLTVLADAIAAEVDAPGPGGIKIFFGSSGTDALAEVRVNGVVSKPASDLLLDLDWPRFHYLAVLRTFIVLVHEE